MNAQTPHPLSLRAHSHAPPSWLSTIPCRSLAVPAAAAVAVAAGLLSAVPSPPPFLASPPPTVTGRRASVRSQCCVRRQSMLAHDADTRLPYHSQPRTPDRPS